MHSVWRAGFDECHGSDICDSDNWAPPVSFIWHVDYEEKTWANVQEDAEAPRVFRSIWIPVTMLFLLGNMVLIDKKHTAALSISWKVLWFLQVLTLSVEIPLILVPNPGPNYPSAIAAAQALRATGNEVSGLPSPVLHTCSLSASTEPVFA